MSYKHQRYIEPMQTTEDEEEDERVYATIKVEPYVVRDSHLVMPCHVNNMSDIEAEQLKGTVAIKITDEEIAVERAGSCNTYTRGDAFAKLLAERIPEGYDVDYQMKNESTIYVFIKEV